MDSIVNSFGHAILISVRIVVIVIKLQDFVNASLDTQEYIAVIV